MGWMNFNHGLKMRAMQPLSHLECFVQSAESGSFSAAARLMGLTPAAVSKNVARLEANLGVRLFQRSTRRLALTEGGQRLLAQIRPPLTALADAVDHAAEAEQQPAGTLKVSMGLAFGRAYLVPLLTEFLQRYPAIQPDWRFDNRQVDLIGEGFDAGIGGGLYLRHRRRLPRGLWPRRRTRGIVGHALQLRIDERVVDVADRDDVLAREPPRIAAAHAAETDGRDIDRVARRLEPPPEDMPRQNGQARARGRGGHEGASRDGAHAISWQRPDSTPPVGPGTI